MNDFLGLRGDVLFNHNNGSLHFFVHGEGQIVLELFNLKLLGLGEEYHYFLRIFSFFASLESIISHCLIKRTGGSDYHEIGFFSLSDNLFELL